MKLPSSILTSRRRRTHFLFPKNDEDENDRIFCFRHEEHKFAEEDMSQIEAPLVGNAEGFQIDDDCAASSSSCSTTESEIEIEKGNAKRSLFSDILFLVGSSLYLVLSIYDLPYYNDDDNGDDDYYDYNDYDGYWFQDKYTVLSVMGSCMMFYNAAYDFCRARHFKKQQEDQQQLHDDNGDNDDTHNFNGRRDGNPQWDICAAQAFGFAAIIDFANVFVGYYEMNENLSANLWITSALFYLLNACIALSGNGMDSPSAVCPSCPFCSSSSDPVLSCDYVLNNKYGPSFLLETIGDIFFFVGAFIDVIISIVSDPNLSYVKQHTLGRWNI
eukprot:6545374-Ditylum_brightwellii.AAC.1